jgi:hypothetical protein
MLAHFAARGWIGEAADGIQVRPEGRAWLKLLVAQIQPVLENYRALLAAVRESSLPQTQEKVFADAAAALEDHLLLGEASRPEAVCPTTSSNALQALIDDEIVVANGNPRRPRTQLDRGPRWGALDEWLSRLARALG